MKTKFSEDFPDIGAPALSALDGIGVENLQDLTKYSKKELLTLHGFGPKALRMVEERLKRNGLALAGR